MGQTLDPFWASCCGIGDTQIVFHSSFFFLILIQLIPFCLIITNHRCASTCLSLDSSVSVYSQLLVVHKVCLNLSPSMYSQLLVVHKLVY
ncbi:hypothetical protein PGT21_023627 [Puccinia graminis f. sp. tritici]|uniref:Uncharacterized protein n=1 Tax=Puccinia graminis f. sp. tritici TaxID=56615 RepID=A0A5B0M947_PUCGR|nr:hypothetical protein PGT21_023627 [Puccinia graminis f. sp. tritici]